MVAPQHHFFSVAISLPNLFENQFGLSGFFGFSYHLLLCEPMASSSPHHVAMAHQSVDRLVASGALKVESKAGFDELVTILASDLSRGVPIHRAEMRLLIAASSLQKKKGEKGRGEDDENAVDEEVETEVFQQYRCKSIEGLAFGGEGRFPSTHPGDIAESGLLASVPLPNLKYCTKALDECVAKGVLSDLQVEGVLHACQRHTALNCGVRAGFFLGDGAGVGKGRQIAGMILDNAARGRMKHVWFSISGDLRLDAERDLRDVGCHLGVIDGCQSLDATAKLAFGSREKKRGVLFSTYSTLISAFGSSSSGGKQARLAQLVAWCGGREFSGLLVFDESHKSKNFDVKKQENSTKMSQAVIAIQDQLPLARVVYASATGVTDVTNMAYASRVGLFGPGTSFESFRVFAESMEKRGVGALEMLALELKASGAYVSRGLSWSRCEFEHVVCGLPPDATHVYDSLAQWWRALRRALEYALGVVERLGATKGRRGMTWQRFWGSQLRFFKEVQTALKVPFVVQEAKRALRDDCVVVIGLQSTGEAGLDAAMKIHNLRPGDVVPGGLVAAAKIAARVFVEEHFPTAPSRSELPTLSADDEMIKRLLQVENCPPPSSEQIARYKSFMNQSTPEPEDVPELVKIKREALQQLEALEVPPSPLDSLIDALGGTSAVAEMTGRSSRITRKTSSIDEPLRYEQRIENSKNQQCDSLNVRERKAFMEGKKPVAIISDAASTGVSLHAANGVPSAHKRRVHITLELAWSADKSIQQLGRSHRANQASAPVYKLLTTDLAGENRFAAAVAKRLSSLGAITKGDRRAASGQDMAEFDIDNKHGRTALSKMATACSNRFDNVIASSITLTANSNKPLRDALDAVRSTSSKDASYTRLDEFGFYDFASMFESAGRIFETPAKGGESCVADGSVSADVLDLAILARRAYAELDVDPKKANEVRTFLNRLQSLPVSAQRLLFEYFSACHRAEIAEAKRNGTLDTGVADIRTASAVVDRSEVVGTDPLSGAVTTLSEVLLDRGVCFEDAVAKHDDAIRAEREENVESLLFEQRKENARAGQTGFYLSQRPLPSTQNHGVLLAVRKTGTTNFVVTRPNTGTSPFEMAIVDLKQRYKPVSIESEEHREKLRKKWTRDYEEAEKSGGRGARVCRVGLVSGAVLPYWQSLEKTVAENTNEMTRAEQALKVCRIGLDDGQKLVGIRFPHAVLGALRNNMQAQNVAKRVAFSSMKVESPTPIDVKALAAASTAPKTMRSYFTAAVPKENAAEISGATTSKNAKREAPSITTTTERRRVSKTSRISNFFQSADRQQQTEGVYGGKKHNTAAPLASRQPVKASSSTTTQTLVECPICESFVDVANMNYHLDHACPGAPK